MMATEAAIRIKQHLAQPLDGSSLFFFRRAFGVIIAIAALRFMAYGWIDELLVEPEFLFSWVPGVQVLPRELMYALFLGQIVAGVSIALQWKPRLWLALWLVTFIYVELLDKTLYLNHYVLFTALGLALLWLPAQGPSITPRWLLWLMRVLVGSVYLWAGINKLNPDWLFAAEPLSTWLSARVDTPFIGHLIAKKETAFFMSWAGAAYDLAIPFLLLWSPTRIVGLMLVAVFHISVGLLFPIGIFPVLMIACSTLFCDAAWPRRWFKLPAYRAPRDPVQISNFGLAVWSTAIAVMVLAPGRHLLNDSHVNWSEQGFRFAWRVMLIEKTGLVDYRLVDKNTGSTWHVRPGCHLTPLQHKQMRTQPDMIRDFAVYLKGQHSTQGRDVEVYVDSWASLHQRPAQRMIRPDIDLTLPLDHLHNSEWILPLVSPSPRHPLVDR